MDFGDCILGLTYFIVRSQSGLGKCIMLQKKGRNQCSLRSSVRLQRALRR
jgi:hypothetical protein